MKRFEKLIIGILVVFLFLVVYFLFPVKSTWNPELSNLYAGQYRVVGYEYLQIATTTGLTSSKYYDSTSSKILADYAYMTVTTAGITYCLDGTKATATQCHQVANGGSITLSSYDELSKFNANKQSATGGLAVTYKKWYE